MGESERRSATALAFNHEGQRTTCQSLEGTAALRRVLSLKADEQHTYPRDSNINFEDTQRSTTRIEYQA
jgi:hypothetical protein